LFVASALTLIPFVLLHDARATSRETQLYAFPNRSDGDGPLGGLIADDAGNFYGTTEIGGVGAYRDVFEPQRKPTGAGTVFKLAPDGTETVLYSFTGGSDGAFPFAGLASDKAGNLYGTASMGGEKLCYGGQTCGTVFKLAPDGNLTVLHSFTGGSDGWTPYSGVIVDKKGNAYGTTFEGGSKNGAGGGTVFEITPDGKEKILHAFSGGSDGTQPHSSLLLKKGILYGTTDGGGAYEYGTVFSLARDGTETVLYTFTGGSDGALPEAGLIADRAGNLYGTAWHGGANGAGAVFRLTPDGTETVLYSFCSLADCADGDGPYNGVIMDRSGNLYGTTISGGTSCGCGTVFEVTPGGTETLLYAFTGGSDGAGPEAGLLADRKGNLYGETVNGGSRGCYRRYGCGTIFRVKP
jgi:uncharacterized repeat protein (TIGR03803 family)